MMPIKRFNEYLKENIAKKQSPDISRSRALIIESERSMKILDAFIKEFKIENDNANHIIKNAYDIIMELIRARMLLDGFNSSGKGAHEAEVSYLREISFKDKDIEFANELRYFRNGILYYGKSFDKEYAEKVLNFLKKIYPVLKK